MENIHEDTPKKGSCVEIPRNHSQNVPKLQFAALNQSSENIFVSNSNIIKLFKLEGTGQHLKQSSTT